MTKLKITVNLFSNNNFPLPSGDPDGGNMFVLCLLLIMIVDMYLTGGDNFGGLIRWLVNADINSLTVIT